MPDLSNTERIAMQANMSNNDVVTPEDRKRYFGMPFRLARIEQEKKQQDICNDSNISPYYLSQIERGIGNPSLDMMVRLARSLGKKLKITLE